MNDASTRAASSIFTIEYRLPERPGRRSKADGECTNCADMQHLLKDMEAEGVLAFVTPADAPAPSGPPASSEPPTDDDEVLRGCLLMAGGHPHGAGQGRTVTAEDRPKRWDRGPCTLELLPDSSKRRFPCRSRNLPWCASHNTCSSCAGKWSCRRRLRSRRNACRAQQSGTRNRRPHPCTRRSNASPSRSPHHCWSRRRRAPSPTETTPPSYAHRDRSPFQLAPSSRVTLSRTPPQGERGSPRQTLREDRRREPKFDEVRRSANRPRLILDSVVTGSCTLRLVPAAERQYVRIRYVGVGYDW